MKMPEIGHTWSDKSLLKESLTHRSAGPHHNERMEFLGDAVLGLLIADILYKRHPEATEGQLSRLRADLVQKKTLARIGEELQLGEVLILGPGERHNGGQHRPSILASTVEAILGAVYLDGGLESCRKVVENLFADRLERAVPEELHKDPKSALQEYLQKKHIPLPVYTVLNASGKAHNMRFEVACHVSSLSSPSIGKGRSHQEAEQQAARLALNRLHAGD
ncbi:MAG: ribonuclease III [Gammaproteobacteria bacterium]|nr:MAG: ribonuclease III [Gammaproteobacteria bacterium]